MINFHFCKSPDKNNFPHLLGESVHDDCCQQYLPVTRGSATIFAVKTKSDDSAFSFSHISRVASNLAWPASCADI